LRLEKLGRGLVRIKKKEKIREMWKGFFYSPPAHEGTNTSSHLQYERTFKPIPVSGGGKANPVAKNPIEKDLLKKSIGQARESRKRYRKSCGFQGS